MTSQEAYLTIVEAWLRDNRGIVFTEGSVDDLCERVAAGVNKGVDAERERCIAAITSCPSLDDAFHALGQPGKQDDQEKT